MNHPSRYNEFDTDCYAMLEERLGPVFEPELMADICRLGKVKKYNANEVVMDIGAEIAQMPIVMSGSIKVMREDSKGDELLLYYLEVGETCAVTLNCCSRRAKSAVRAVVETDVELVFVPIVHMDDWMAKYQSWRAFVLGSYAERLSEMMDAFDNVVFHSLEERLQKYLREKAMITKSADLQISHQDIANDLYSSRVAVSRLMRKLEQNGIIRQGRNKVVVLEFTG